MKLTNLEWTNLEVSTVSDITSTSTTIENLKLDSLKLRKTFIKVKGDDVSIKNLEVNNLDIDPISHEILISSESSSAFDTSTFDMEDFKISNLKDAKYADNSGNLSSQFLKINHGIVNVITWDITDTEIQKFGEIISLTATLNKINLIGDFRARSSLMHLKGDLVTVSDLTIENLEVDPTGIETLIKSEFNTKLDGSRYTMERFTINNLKDV